jgi:hypothetical protein
MKNHTGSLAEVFDEPFSVAWASIFLKLLNELRQKAIPAAAIEMA